MGEKLFTVSFDDGTVQDRRVIELMERYGIRGTFNLSSGLFGKKSYIRLMDGRGRSCAEKDESLGGKFVDHFILSREEALRLYSRPNVEVASHGTHHRVQSALTREEAAERCSTHCTAAASAMHGGSVICSDRATSRLTNTRFWSRPPAGSSTRFRRSCCRNFSTCPQAGKTACSFCGGIATSSTTARRVAATRIWSGCFGWSPLQRMCAASPTASCSRDRL